MFRLFKKKQILSPMEALLNMAIEDFMEKWMSFTKTTRFKSSASLSENIDIFAQPSVEFFKKRYMTLYQFGGSIFWYTVSEAILKSKTHPQDAVNLAFKELDAKNV